MSEDSLFVVHRMSGGCACFCSDGCGVCDNCGMDLNWREKDRSPAANRSRKAERSAIVKWLRHFADFGVSDTQSCSDVHFAADAIERGEHLK